MTTLIVPAAGSGQRFGGPLPKQLLLVAGRPVLAWTLAAFAGAVDQAVLAVSAEVHDAVAAIAATAPFPCQLVIGGATRQASVATALAACPPGPVLVHDAVRPCVPRRCIDDCLAALKLHAGAVVAVPCAATVKRSDDGRTVVTTVPREPLWLAQTPQGFDRDIALAAFARAAREGWDCSDDVQVLERCGLSVALVRGDARNLKITTPDDLVVAEALLARLG